jgi:exonuclease SbcC
MKKIYLEKIKINNFKKVGSLEIDFSDNNEIFGDNGSGKTTVFDAFTWLLFGKDSLGATKFEIKKLDENNNPVHKKEHSVFAKLHVDEQCYDIKRVYREEWVKKRGDEHETFSGHETIFEVNSMIYNTKKYKDFVADIIDEETFKLLTSTTFFAKLKWEDRKRIAFSLVDNVSNEEIAEKSEDFKKLVAAISGKDFELYRKEIKARISPLKKELENIKNRIEGTRANISDDIDIEPLKKELKSLRNPNEINKEIESKRSEIENEISKQRQISDQDYQLKISNKDKRDIEISNKKDKLSRLQADLKNLGNEREGFVQKYYYERDKKYSATSCSECGVNTFEVQEALFSLIESGDASDKIKNLYESLSERNVSDETSFNQNKVKAIKGVNESGCKVAEKIKSTKQEIESAETWIKENHALPDVVSVPFDDSELRKRMPELKEVDSSEYEERVADINKKIGTQEEIERTKVKLEDDIKLQKETSKKLASLEKTEFICEKFAKRKSDLYVEKINSMFSFVKFKLFETQVNGGEVECCEIIADGVPYSTNLNTGAKVNAGIDVVNTLSNHYKIQCPVFIDNIESCTAPLQMDSQQIKLIVNKEFKELKIVTIK